MSSAAYVIRLNDESRGGLLLAVLGLSGALLAQYHDAATVDRAVHAFLARPDADSLRSVSVAEQNPFKMWLMGEAGALGPCPAQAAQYQSSSS